MAAATKDPKPLHLATSLKELNSKTTNENIQKANPKLLCKSADKLYLTARDKIIEGDQEHAYVLLLRYLDIVKVIRASKEYKSSKKTFDGLLDGSKIKRALDDAEKLAVELEKRYEAVRKEEEEELLKAKDPDSSENILLNNEDSIDTFVTSEQLYQLLTDSGDDTLVVDCRTRRDYTTSHVDSKRYPQWLSVPEEVIKSGNLTTFMSSSNRKLWEERGSNGRSNIILVDEKSVKETLDSLHKQPILLLKEKLEKEKLIIRILEGGYNIWYLTYSPLCVGKWKDKDIPKSNDQIKTGDELSYPTLPISNVEGHQVQGNLVTESPHDPPLLPQLVTHHNPPTVNRLTKPSGTPKPPEFDSSVDLTRHSAGHSVQPGGQSSGHSIQVQPNSQSTDHPMQHSGQHTGYPLQPSGQHTGYPLQSSGQLTGHNIMQSANQLTGHPKPITHNMHSGVQPLQPSGYEGQFNGPPYVQPIKPSNPTAGQPSIVSMQPSSQPSGLNIRQHISTPVYSGGHPVGYPLGQSSHLIGQGMQPTDRSGPLQSTNDQHYIIAANDSTNYTAQPVFTVLPPAPSVHLPLDLEGRSMLLSQDLQNLGPSSVDFLDDWYPSDDMKYFDSGVPVYTNTEDVNIAANATATQPVSVHYNNPRLTYGPLPVPPTYADAQYFPSHPPVQPPLPPPVSIDIPEESSEADLTEANIKKKVDENELNDENVKASQIEEIRRIKEEIIMERTKMMEEIENEREKNKATLAEERKQQQLEFEQRTLEMERKLKEQYEKEKSAILKNQEDMKHYWESRQLENQQQRQVVINQGLPTGWEKRLDRTTGRFYYIDHNTHSTHWNPPTSLLQYQQHLVDQSTPGVYDLSISEASKLPTGPGQPIPQYLSGYHGSSKQGQQPVPQVPPIKSFIPSVSPSSLPLDEHRQQPSSSPSVQHPGKHGQPALPSSMPSAQSARHQPLPSGSSPQPSTGQRQQPKTSGPSSHPSAGHEQQSQVLRPQVDRASKPNVVQPMAVEVYRQKILSLQPVQGGLGPGLTGLRNLGNTCFMSSVIQCLCSTPHLIQYFYSNSYRVDLNRSNPLGTKGVLAEEFYILVVAMWLGKFRHISPHCFKSVVSQFASYFAGNQQHDCQEFLVYLLDGLHEDLNKILVKSYIEMPDTDDVSDTVGAEQAWVAHKKRNRSVIVDLFHGLLKSTITCLSCGKKKVMFEPFVSLSVPIPQGRSSCSYHDCMKLFTKRELMTGNNKWFCPKCKVSRDSEKTLFIWRLPPVLLLHFKRFQDKGNVREKMVTHISFPLESLDLSQYIAGPKPKKRYNLYAISNHTGNLQSGHYTATCKNPRNQKFYYFDDHEVREATSKDLNTVSAYLLFYTCESLKI